MIQRQGGAPITEKLFSAGLGQNLALSLGLLDIHIDQLPEEISGVLSETIFRKFLEPKNHRPQLIIGKAGFFALQDIHLGNLCFLQLLTISHKLLKHLLTWSKPHHLNGDVDVFPEARETNHIFRQVQNPNRSSHIKDKNITRGGH